MEELCEHPGERHAANNAEHAGATAKIAQPITATSSNPSNRHALVVEAAPEIRRLCRDVLERSGFVVDAVPSGIAAVVSARYRTPDLILMNFQLPDVPGREAIGWLRSNPDLQSTPIIVLKPSRAEDADFLAAGPIVLLRKPISAQTIQIAISQALDHLSKNASKPTTNREYPPCL